MKIHEADGLYYLTGERAEQLHACAAALAVWNKAHTKRRRVRITYAVMLAQEQALMGWGSARWCIETMYRQQKITVDEYLDAVRYWGATALLPHARAHAFMDLLAVRARREGRL